MPKIGKRYHILWTKDRDRLYEEAVDLLRRLDIDKANDSKNIEKLMEVAIQRLEHQWENKKELMRLD